VTTFIDRDHAIEAHQAVLDFLEFQNQLRRIEELGLAMAARLGLGDAESRRFAESFVDQFITEPNGGADRGRWAVQMEPPAAIADAARDPHHPVWTTEYPKQSWAEFVISQIFQLFTAKPLIAEEAVPAVPPSAPAN
jgi:hypothetical protein